MELTAKMEMSIKYETEIDALMASLTACKNDIESKGIAKVNKISVLDQADWIVVKSNNYGPIFVKRFSGSDTECKAMLCQLVDEDLTAGLKEGLTDDVFTKSSEDVVEQTDEDGRILTADIVFTDGSRIEYNATQVSSLPAIQ